MTERAPVHSACPWHRDQLQGLIVQHASGQLPHALLIGGPAGIGKQRLAQSLLEALLCRQPVGGLACGACQACHLTTAGSHPDLFIVEPEEAGKAIKVDQVRELVAFCSRTAQFGGQRVVLLAPAEAMNRNAQNALLKTLEEPGEGVLLLLVSHQPGRLLPTVRSRCQKRLLAPPAAAEALAWLTGQVGEQKRAAALLDAAGGAPLTALELEGSDWFPARARLLGQCLALVRGRLPVSLAAREFLVADPLSMLDALMRWSHAGLRFLACGTPPADEQLAGPLIGLAEQVGAPRLLRFADQAALARRALARGNNPNRELLFEQLLLVLVGVDTGRST